MKKEGGKMKRTRVVFGVLFLMIGLVSLAFAAYHHEGEADAPNFLAQYPKRPGPNWIIAPRATQEASMKIIREKW